MMKSKVYNVSFWGSSFLLMTLTSLAYASSPKLNKVVAHCPDKATTTSFVMQPNGTIAQTGGTQEGPACIQVLYDPFRFDVTISTASVTTAGKDLSTFGVGGQSQGSGGGATPLLSDISSAVNQLRVQAASIADALAHVKTFLDVVDADVKTGKDSMALQDAEQQYETVLIKDFGQLANAKKNISATDLTSGSCPSTSALSQPLPDSLAYQILTLQQSLTRSQTKSTQDLADATDALTQAQASLKSAQTADVAAAQAKLNVSQAAQVAAQSALDAVNDQIRQLGGYQSVSDLYKCGGAGLTALNANIAILQFWQDRLAKLGFAYDPKQAPRPDSSVFWIAQQFSCNGLFNQNQNSTLSISFSDESPTLTGGSATASSAAQSFYTVSCSSPFSISAGVEMSGIRDQEYQIVAASGPNNTSVNEFGYSNNSPIHLLPLALTSVRLWETDSRKFAYHFSVGISGNLQGVASGGSTAEFLVGPSLSLFRTMYITAGAHIGYRSVLAGDYSVGDVVPSTVQTPQVYKSATVRYGIAITFAKP